MSSVKQLIPVLSTLAVSSLLLGGVYNARSAALLAAQDRAAGPIEDLSLSAVAGRSWSPMKPWEDPDADAAAFITGSPAVQPALAALRGRMHAGAESEAEEGTEEQDLPRERASGSSTGAAERRGGVELFNKIKGAADAHERVRRLAGIAKQTRAILAKIAAANGGVAPKASRVILDNVYASKTETGVAHGAQRSRTWLVDSAMSARAPARGTRGRSPVFARNNAPVGMAQGGAEKLGAVHLQNLGAQWGHPVAADRGGDTESGDGVEDVNPGSEGMSVAGGGSGGAAVQRLRSAVQGPSGIAELGETADEAYDGNDDASDSDGNPDAGSWVGGQYHSGRAGADDEMSDAPWEFHGEPGRASNPSKMDTDLPHPGQVPDLVSDHIHNREFEEMLNHCKGDASCSALLSKGFWWLYGKPWRRCSQNDPYACIPYHCAANQEGTTSCKAINKNPIQALADMDVRCWDKGRSMYQFMMTRDGCKDYLPWRGGTGEHEYLRIGYNCHGCDEEHDAGPPCYPITVDHHEKTCSMHWTECKPGSGPGSNGISKNWGGSGDAGSNDWLAGHVVQCPANSYLSEWRVSRERCVSGHLRIHYRCCERYWGPCRTETTSGSTSEWADGLENHNVQCDAQTESLNHFEWTGSAFSYTCCCENACCEPAFGGGRDKATQPYWPAGKQYPIHPAEPQRPDDGAWTTTPPDAPYYTPADSLSGGYARPPPDDSAWLRGELGMDPHDATGVWKGDAMAQLASIAKHFDGKPDQK